MKKILIAEDDDNLRLLYERSFIDDGFSVLLAANGREAVKLTKSENPDIVIMDIRMPGMDGLAAMNEIKSYAKKIPVIINTAYPLYQDDFTTWPAAAYILKSADLSSLKTAVNEALSCV
ncbi:response regulator [candidate division KSB1 bacterium]